MLRLAFAANADTITDAVSARRSSTVIVITTPPRHLNQQLVAIAPTQCSPSRRRTANPCDHPNASEQLEDWVIVTHSPRQF
ncbi:hypothetical protein LAUMK7_00005 [Mycobacterium kansasii]|uniref:Uncharacterized protein n=1 Tax=Mycobacterium pseudokansasii TaxID=2341080 RepID=A0A498QZE3_9MYCO|nr:hypothetical protein LAUMK7_00005 [Mycobacterium kansasii]VBA33545.1 hypothetical protein LAUMK35_05500 [Mycobacterium pseudokansasii]VBA35122.1 hypothetical protein LAUMK21_05460 [Mycobacterium pseudokansasii]VBA56246.1 hypothetical protein LAUMK142_05458 [Mycobacterium pseudokansasii]